MTLILAAMAAALTAAQDAAPPAPAASPEAVQAIEVTAAGRVKGDMRTGTLAYPPAFFTAVRPGSALDMVGWLPGFTFEDSRELRGLGSAGGNVLIDGKPPTSKTDTLLNVLRRIPAERVERVDLIVGSAPGIDMRGRNIVANVILKPAPAPQKTVQAQTYVDERGRLSPQVTLTFSDKQNQTVSEASLELSRNIVIYPGFGYGHMTRRDAAGALSYAADETALYGGPSVVGSASHERPFGAGRLRISGSTRYFGNEYRDDYRLRPGPGSFLFRTNYVYFQNEFGLRYERNAGPWTAESQALGRTTAVNQEDYNTRPPAVTTENGRARQAEAVLRGGLRFKRDETLALEASAEAALNTTHTRTTGTVGGVRRLSPGFDVEEQRGEAGATAAWKPNAVFSLDAAVKVEVSRVNAAMTGGASTELTRRFAYLKPKLAIAWAIDKQTQLRLRAEHEVGQVRFDHYLTYSDNTTGQVQVGNPRLKPDRALIGEAVLQRTFWTGGDISLTVRPRRLFNVVDVAPVSSSAGLIGTVVNIGGGRQTEVIAGLTLPLKPLGVTGGTLKGSVTLNRMRVTDPTDGRRRSLSYEPAREAELRYAQDLPGRRLNFGIDAFYRGKTTGYIPFGNTTNGAWTHINLFAEYRPAPAWTLRAEVQNLPASKVRQTNSLYAGPRDTAPLIYVDDLYLSVGPLLLLRLRRTFG